jgi:hypothetical protein
VRSEVRHSLAAINRPPERLYFVAEILSQICAASRGIPDALADITRAIFSFVCPFPEAILGIFIAPPQVLAHLLARLRSEQEPG